MSFLKISIVAGLICASNLSFAAKTTPVFNYNAQLGEVYQQATGLVWQACAAGMESKKGKCVGEPLELDWHEATTYIEQYNQKHNSHWRLPTQEELVTLVQCEHHAIPGGEGKLLDGCMKPYNKKHSIKPKVFHRLPDAIWTGTGYIDGEYHNRAYYVDYEDQRDHVSYKDASKIGVLLVRGNPFSQHQPYTIQYRDGHETLPSGVERLHYYGACNLSST